MTASPFSSAQAARQRLGDRLREIREDAGLSGRALAAAAGWHGGSKISKIEHAVRPPSPDDIRLWCQVCGVGSERAEELIAALRAAESMWLDWRRAEQTGLLPLNVQVRSIFESTRLLRAYSSKVVPGLLQSSAYTRAVLSAIRDSRKVPVDDVDAVLIEREARKAVLREGDHRFVFVVEESVLRYRIGASDVMAAQLRHLLEVSALPSVSLGVIPQDADRSLQHPAESFVMFDNTRVNVELVSGYLTVTEPAEVGMYMRVFSHLVALAVHGRRARALLDAALRAFG
ncbi:helix-turn-helix domain-containing protein [Actinomadura gamaensis]|uniref:Helix-turn-helix domain-containing protein n=1 Tax=Actinomadura gamaensis TaxID=1763541 RepID=A0ABV9TSZ6_9ACTN